MKIKIVKALIILLTCLAAVAMPRMENDEKENSAQNEISVSEIRDYRNMLRVNEKPIDMVESTKLMCAAPQFIFGPHYDPGVVYYINEIARTGLRVFPNKKLFPIGSIIVKEKQERKTEDSVQIITVMKKLRSGRSEDSWQYKMYDVKKWTEVNAASKSSSVNSSCIACHREYKDNDYVSNEGMRLLLGK